MEQHATRATTKIRYSFDWSNQTEPRESCHDVAMTMSTVFVEEQRSGAIQYNKPCVYKPSGLTRQDNFFFTPGSRNILCIVISGKIVTNSLYFVYKNDIYISNRRLMIITQKVTYLAFSLHDGKSNLLLENKGEALHLPKNARKYQGRTTTGRYGGYLR